MAASGDNMVAVSGDDTMAASGDDTMAASGGDTMSTPAAARATETLSTEAQCVLRRKRWSDLEDV
eukprot:5758043-Pleurochrysis_carterae.AAC.1